MRGTKSNLRVKKMGYCVSLKRVVCVERAVFFFCGCIKKKHTKKIDLNLKYKSPIVITPLIYGRTVGVDPTTMQIYIHFVIYI